MKRAEKANRFGKLEKKIAAKEISVSLLEAREYKGVTCWCSSDGLCELPLACCEPPAHKERKEREAEAHRASAEPH